MTETYFVRFGEYEEYDIEQDCRCVRYLATSSDGTWHCSVPVAGAKARRKTREVFKEYVVSSMAAKLSPRELHIYQGEEELEIG